jgi:hypothetical protein
MVIPGQSACIACMAHRSAHQWGDTPGPDQPRANTQAQVAGAFIASAIRDFAEQGTCAQFVERCVSLHTRNLMTRSERVFRLPHCPVCHRLFDAAPDAFSLPWLQK